MAIYLLQWLDSVKRAPFYCTHSVVVRAESEVLARKLASERAGDETPEHWLDSGRSSCVLLSSEGPEAVLHVGVR
jgi:hypothetical protein